MQLVTHPNPLLRQKCVPVENGEDLGELVAFMTKTMTEQKAIGIAANQVGVNKRVFLLNMGAAIQLVINPEILERKQDEMSVFVESCLSFPGKKVRTKRAPSIRVRYQSPAFQPIEEVLEGVEACCFQHELDHLNGKSMYDREFNGRM